MRGPFLLVGTAVFVMLVASNMPTPLYAIYRSRVRFSAVELTLIFTAYRMVLIPALLVFGQLSDRPGRRRVIAAGLCGAALSTGLLADSYGLSTAVPVVGGVLALVTVGAVVWHVSAGGRLRRAV